ncbi:MAG: sigma-54-dependent Fis family transcriptional regulator [Methylothermaceae bacterium]|nr:sigma-54-dependent Fis family transcriptional regulator [Methylothermaceae bacterium]
MNKASDPKPLLLVVDDTPANLRLLFDLLSARGFDLSVAEDGESALQQLEYICPDLILLDVRMPQLDGFETCRRLKQRAETRDIPIIFMSALTDTVDKVKGFALGAVDYISKPFQQEEVLARIDTHLDLERLKRRLRESEARLAGIIDGAMDAIVALDQAGVIVLFNRAAERTFRCRSEVAVGGPCTRFLSEQLCQLIEDHMSAPQKPPTWIPSGHFALRADGTSFPVEATLSHAVANGQDLYTLILRDVEARQQAEADRQRLHGLNLYLAGELQMTQAPEDLIGRSPALRRVMEQVRQVAPTDATVLILGETGTGKEVVARAIHALSCRREEALVKLNCAAIPRDLVESELFGHEKGAFTGAVARKLGRFELADKGTLFLDEIGDLPPDLQAKLLRVLQEGEFERVGGTETRRVDVRILAATNRDLAGLAREGGFRADLYYRLSVFPVRLPPLRERLEDLPLLVRHFARRYGEKYGRRFETVSARVMAALKSHPWPGNIRELEHVIERAVILSRGTELLLEEEFSRTDSPEQPPRLETLEEAERAHILKVLKATGWRVSGRDGAAELLGLKRSTLESRMKKLGIRRPV